MKITRTLPIAITVWCIVGMLCAPSRGQDAGAKLDGPATTGDGLIRNEPQAFRGYTLLSPLQSKSAYLIDMEGHVVKTWKSEYTPASLAYLLASGDLLRPAENPRPVFGAGGGTGGRVQRFNWDGELTWDYLVSDDKIVAHHDIAPMPNGNVMILVKERISDQRAIAAGRVPASVQGSELYPDGLIEVRPTGLNSGEVVWKWRLWDHLVQEYDPSKENYGAVADHPERVDLNFDEGIVGARLGDPAPATQATGPGQRGRGGRGAASNPDWTHTNAVAYNAALDQLMLSVHEFSEVWIIDHSATTEEAAGHTGGRHGKGGDLLYRWGNPIVYRAGTEADRRLFAQHDAHWIESGLSGAGNMLLFNNGVGRPGGVHSTVDEVGLPVDKDGNYALGKDGKYGPAQAVWSYAAPNPPDFYSNFISSAQRLPNGNTLICSGANGIMFEVTPDKQVVWNYMNPWRDERTAPGAARGRGRGAPAGGPGGARGGGGPSGRSIFRAYRFAPDFPALVGKDLTPGKTLVELTETYYAQPDKAGEKAPQQQVIVAEPPVEPLTLSYREAPKGEVVASEAALKALAKTRPWAMLCALGMFVYAVVGGTLGSIWLVVLLAKAGQPGVPLAQFVVLSTVNLVGAPLALVGGLLAIWYHAAAGRADRGRNSEDLERALIAQGRIWRWAGATVIALFALPVIIFGVGWITGAWR